MKYCSKCGNQVFDEAVICPKCGCEVEQKQNNYYQQPAKKERVVNYERTQERESPSMASTALLFAFLVPIVGIILGIIGMNKYRTQEYRKKCRTALIVGIVVQVVLFFFSIIVMSMMGM